MKARVALVLGSLAAAVAARAEVEFAGYMRTPQGEARFVLTDPAAQKTSEWIGVGGSFAGHRVTGFEAKGELLTVEKDGATRQLRLKSAAVVAAGAGTARVSSPPTRTEELQAEVLKMRTELLKLQLEERDALQQKAVKLRATLPAGHPDILQMEADIAKFTEKIDQNQVERNRIMRSQLLKQISEAGSPEEKARLEESLRPVEARLAKAGAVMEGKKN